MTAGTLHLVCGKIAAGKSTLCARLAQAPGTVLISADYWLRRLFGDEMKEAAGYVRVLPKLCAPMGGHVTQLLKLGVDVVFDFPANSTDIRAWMKGIAEAAGAPHILHWIDLSDEICGARLRRRYAGGDHAASDEEFDLFLPYFQPPEAAEGMNVAVE